MKRNLLKAITKFFGAKVPLSTAIRHNRIEDVKIAVEMKVDLNYHSLYNGGQSFIYPLMTCVYFGRKELCAILLRERADPNFKYKASTNRTIDNFSDHCEYNGNYSEFFWKEFVPFYDPKCRVSNEIVPPRRPFDMTGWKRITPTVLAFVYGDYDILELCLSKGGRLCTSFDTDYYSLIWYFLEHPMTCHSSICELLIKYREFSVTDFEQKAFQNFCEKLEVMKRHVHLSSDLTRDLEKIIMMLMNYGFKSRRGVIDYYQFVGRGDFSPSPSSSTTSSDGDGNNGRFIRYCIKQRGNNQQQSSSQEQQQGQPLASQNVLPPSRGMGNRPSNSGGNNKWRMNNNSSSSTETTSSFSLSSSRNNNNSKEENFFSSLCHLSSSTTTSPIKSSTRQEILRRSINNCKQQQQQQQIIGNNNNKESKQQTEQQNNNNSSDVFKLNFFTSRISSHGKLESNVELVRNSIEYYRKKIAKKGQ